MRGDLPDDIKLARIYLSEWGIWHKMTHNLDAKARLATPREGVRSENRALEVSNLAMMGVREGSYDYFDILRHLYENQHLSAKRVFDAVGGSLRLNSTNTFNKMRIRAERDFIRKRESVEESLDFD